MVSFVIHLASDCCFPVSILSVILCVVGAGLSYNIHESVEFGTKHSVNAQYPIRNHESHWLWSGGFNGFWLADLWRRSHGTQNSETSVLRWVG